jgi:hypothetical protein
MEEPNDKSALLVFEIGKKIEQTQEAYEFEHKDLLAMKNAFAMAAKCLEDYREKMIKEMNDAKLPIKEVEIGKLYVSRCVELISNLCLTTEQKRLRAEGSVDALKKSVVQIKEIYDRERSDNNDTLFTKEVQKNEKYKKKK